MFEKSITVILDDQSNLVSLVNWVRTRGSVQLGPDRYGIFQTNTDFKEEKFANYQ